MKKYTTLEIVKRAKEFADISNSDIISFEEELNYLNDAWKSLYQLMINKHDLFFIKEKRLIANGTGKGYTEYTLPNDVYQIESISDPWSGSVWTRHSVSEGFDNGSYEIVNNKLRIYGLANNLVLRYWINPLYLTFPNKKLQIDSYDILDTAGNNVLTTEGKIINLISGNILADNLTGLNEYTHLGNGHIGTTIIIDGVRYLIVIGYNGTEIVNRGIEPTDKIYWFKDSNYNLYYTINDKLYKGNKVVLEDVDVSSDGVFIDGKLIEGNCFPIEFEGKNVYLKNDDDRVTINYTEGKAIEVDVDDIIIKGFCSYGLITSNGAVDFLQSFYPNVELNLPNEIFFSLLAAQLATYYCAKQNASNDGVTAMLMAYRQQYMDSLSQDSTYGRIINVY